MNDKQAFHCEAVVSTVDGSAKDSKSSQQFRELETPRPQGPLPVKVRSKNWLMFAWALRYFAIIICVGVPLAVPVIVFAKDRVNIDRDTVDGEVLTEAAATAERQHRNLFFFVFAWLLVTWLGGFVADMIILAFPYIFRFVAGYVNPGHQRYWRVFRVLRMPITLLGTVIASYISFETLINKNPLLLVNAINKDADTWAWDDTIDDVLQQCVFWVVAYLLEKILILYITIHYHYRSDQVKNTHSKEMHTALVTLYKASVYLHPVGSKHFVEEDAIIRNAFGSESESASRAGASSFLRKIGMDGHKTVQFFGSFAQSNTTHWLQANSPYSVVERCLAHPKSAAALAKRVWMSLVVQGSEAFSAEDIAEVLGPYRRDEAKEIFKIIDENESGDIRLDEMVWTVVEAGRIRHAIYQNMHDINHCINNFDWIALLFLAIVMIYFIMVAYVDTIAKIKETISFLILGLTVGLGRVILKYLLGCVFVFFEHPFDIGDRVNVYNMSGTNPVACTVTRLSLLYTIFRRIDNGTDLQITNDRLMQKRVENVSRSGENKQAFTICVDFKTSFKDMMYLRTELEAFLKAHPRDYLPTLGLSMVCVHELNKLELAVAFTHKSNWSNERLRAVRSSKFMCALLVAVRKVPIYRPGGASVGLGEEGKPMYTVQIADDVAAKKVAAEKKRRAGLRMDAVKEEEVDEAAKEAAKEKEERLAAEQEANELALMSLTKIPAAESVKHNEAEAASTGVDTLLNSGSTGLRAKADSGPAGMFYQQ